MRNNLIVFVIVLVFFKLNINGQSFYKDSLIEIKGFINEVDSSYSFRIKNLSDSILLFNGFEPKYVLNRDFYVSGFNLISTGVSLIQPGLSELMFFKKLYPNSTMTITIVVNDSFDNSDFNPLLDFYLDFQFVVISNGFVIQDRIRNKYFKDEIKKHKFKLFEYGLIFKKSENSSLNFSKHLLSIFSEY